MQKRILLFLISCLFSSLMFGQIDVPQEQRSLLTKVTATWCPNCGNWGWTFMENIMEDNADKAIILGAHFSGTLQTDEAIALGTNFEVGGQPIFLVNNTNVGANSGNFSAKEAEVQNMINANFTQSPIVNTGITASVSPDNEIVVSTTTRFFQATSGEYYLSVYVLEDNVEANQSGSVSDDIHPRVIRTSFNGSFGEVIAQGSIGMGMEVDKQFSMAMNSAWNMDNLRIAAIVWEKVNDKYEFVNAYDVDTFSPFVGTTTIEATDIDFQIAPTIVQNQGIVSFTTEATIKNATLQIFDVNGRLVNQLFQGELLAGQQQFELNNQGYQGLYFIHLTLDGQILTDRVLFE